MPGKFRKQFTVYLKKTYYGNCMLMKKNVEEEKNSYATSLYNFLYIVIVKLIFKGTPCRSLDIEIN